MWKQVLAILASIMIMGFTLGCEIQEAPEDGGGQQQQQQQPGQQQPGQEGGSEEW